MGVQRGVAKAAAIKATWSNRALTYLYLGILLLACMTSLESQVNYLFIPYITSDFSSHGLLSTIQIVSAVLQTVLKAPSAKVADVFGRTEALLTGILFYALGYLCMSVSTNIWWYAASQIFYIGGNTGIQFLLQLIIADTSSLTNRALLASIPTLPYLWNVWAGPPLGEWLLEDVGWRWGTAIWMIVVPLAAIPLLIILIRKGRQYRNITAPTPVSRSPTPSVYEDAFIAVADEPVGKGELDLVSGELPSPPLKTTEMSRTGSAKSERSSGQEKKPWWQRILNYCDQMDIGGTLVVSAGLALMLVPLTLASSSPDRWTSVGVILPICLGVVLFGVFVYYELHWARYPLVSLRLMKNSSVFFACFGGFFYFFSYYVGRLYFPSYLQVAAGYSPSKAGHVHNVMNFSSVAVGFLVGLAIKWVKRVRPFVISGAVCYLCGLGLLIFVRTPSNRLVALILGQLVLGIGGGLYSGPNQVLVQSHATHQDLGAATALVLVITTLGWSTGAAVAGAIWTNYLPRRLAANLPEDLHDLIDDIASSIVVAQEYPMGTPIRTAINLSYVEVMRLLCIVGVCLGGLQLVCGLLVKSRPITDQVALETDDSKAEIELAVQETHTQEHTSHDLPTALMADNEQSGASHAELAV